MNKFLAMVIALAGIACLVFGIIFVTQAMDAKQQLTDDLSPLKTSEINDKYDAVKAGQEQLMAVEEPKIQTGQAQPSAMYDYLSAQRALLGLARTNNGLTGFVMNNGIVDIVLGLGLLVTGLAFLRK